MKGGTILGEGGYGCVFQPPLSCKNKKLTQTNKNYISKLSKKDEAITEWNMTKKIQVLLPDSTDYILTWNSKCVPDQKQTDKGLKKCQLNQAFKKKSSDFLILQSRNGGNTLENKFKQIMEDWFKSKKSDISKMRIQYIKVINELEPLFKGLYDFSEYNIIHNDIKDANILILEKNVSSLKKGIRYIDFGLSAVLPYDLSLIKKRSKAISYDSRWYYPYPPEYLYCCANKKDIQVELNYKEYKEREFYNTIRSIHVDIVGTAKSNEEFDLTIENIMGECMKKKTKKEYENLFLKTDTYSLGMSLVFLFSYYSDLNDVEFTKFFKMNHNFMNNFKKLLKKMLDLNYKKRISGKEAYSEYLILINKKLP